MSPQRRRWLLRLAASGAALGLRDLPAATPPVAAGDDAPIRRGRLLAFPRDHGAHLRAHTEWWYATGWAGTPQRPTHGLQLTFFRSRTGLAEGSASRFAARQLLFAHAAVTLLQPPSGAPRHLHDQRIARWSGAPSAQPASAGVDSGTVHIANWSLRDAGEHWAVAIPAAGFALDLSLARTQPLLLQGDAGFSRKGPDEAQASHYYSEPQLALSGTLALGDGGAAAGSARGSAVQGRAWLDHEWSDEYLHPQAAGWVWIGFNLFDGSALTAFVLRRADGSALWAGGSLRSQGRAATVFSHDSVRFIPGRSWTSPASGARYPVQWRVETPRGSFEIRALLDAQELDSSASTGTVYWEGLSEALDAQGARVGLGYLEMTGYAGRLKM